MSFCPYTDTYLSPVASEVPEILITCHVLSAVGSSGHLQVLNVFWGLVKMNDPAIYMNRQTANREGFYNALQHKPLKDEKIRAFKTLFNILNLSYIVKSCDQPLFRYHCRLAADDKSGVYLCHLYITMPYLCSREPSRMISKSSSAAVRCITNKSSLYSEKA